MQATQTTEAIKPIKEVNISPPDHEPNETYNLIEKSPPKKSS